MGNVILEWIGIDLLTEIGFPSERPMRLYGDNKASIHITENVVFYDKTKHIEVDCHIIHKKLGANIIVAKYIASRH